MAQGEWTVELGRRARKDLDRLVRAGRPDLVTRTMAALRELERNPLRARAGAAVKALQGVPGDAHRLRIGDIRVMFRLEAERRIVVARVAWRGRAHR